jgi:hypothetical protein
VKGSTVVNVVGGEKSSQKYYLTVTPTSVRAGPTSMTFRNAARGSRGGRVEDHLKAGEYVLVCNVERHYEKGMLRPSS